MSGRHRRPESLWDRKEAQNEAKEFNSSNDSLKRSNSDINDVLMSDDFSLQGNENLLMDNDNISDKHRMKTESAFDDWEGQYGQPYRGRSQVVGVKDRTRSRSRSWSPHRSRDRDQDRDQTRPRDRDRDQELERDRGRTRGLTRSRSRSRSRGRDQGRAMSPSRGGSNQFDNDSTKKLGNNRPEYPGGSQYNRTHKSGHNDQDHRRQSNQDIKIPCKYFIMGRCNRNNCRFLHDVSKSELYEGRPQDHNDFHNSNASFDDKKKSWKDSPLKNLESGVSYSTNLNYNQESRSTHGNADSRNANFNRNGSNHQLNRSVNEDEKPLETSRNNILQASSLTQISENLTLANALGLFSSGGLIDPKVVNEPIKASVPIENQNLMNPDGNMEVNENKTDEKSSMNLGKTEAEGKGDEGNMGNDEKAMRAFKIALVELVKEILKPTWKEGKMSREVYKTIVKKVVEKVTSTIQGVQIPRTQEKTDQYLTFSKSKISKLVEAYVGRLAKA